MSAIIENLENKVSNHFSSCTPVIEKSPNSIFQTVKYQLSIWLERSKQRNALAKLDDRLLDDIGLNRDQVEHEISKPFWK